MVGTEEVVLFKDLLGQAANVLLMNFTSLGRAPSRHAIVLFRREARRLRHCGRLDERQPARVGHLGLRARSRVAEAARLRTLKDFKEPGSDSGPSPHDAVDSTRTRCPKIATGDAWPPSAACAPPP